MNRKILKEFALKLGIIKNNMSKEVEILLEEILADKNIDTCTEENIAVVKKSSRLFEFYLKKRG